MIGAWGIKGGVKVKAFAADPQALFSSRRWFLQPSESKPGHQVPRLLRITSVREQGDAVVAIVQEVNDRDAAQALAGAHVYVSRASFPTPDEDEFYWVDLIGLEVINKGGLALGAVVGLLETGPHCVLRIQPPDADATEVLVPFVDAYVVKVDLPGRQIVVDWESDFSS